MSDIKQVIAVRKDLNMSIGKTSVQVAHASMAFLIDILDAYKSAEDELYDTYAHVNFWGFCNAKMLLWMKRSSTKIVVTVNSEEELLTLYNKAKDAGLTAHIIKDAGRTEFKKPTYTAVAIGPDEAEEIDKLTGHLLLR